MTGSNVQQAASWLCQAATGGNDPVLWAEGEQALRDSDVDQSSCHDAAAVAALERLVEFHRLYPQSKPMLVDAPGTACPLTLTGLSTMPGGDFGDFSLNVPACGGTPVYLRGRVQDAALPPGSVRSVTVGGIPVPVQWEGGPHFIAPPLAGPGPAVVALAQADYPIEQSQFEDPPQLAYAPATGPCPGAGL
ncbi:hypothetical protein [Kocuria sabuli]|uniref:hypothetical protein n=1 Tax=Kocuria sabuli TaxID=3071448 RepID=UPI0034D77A4A